MRSSKVLTDKIYLLTEEKEILVEYEVKIIKEDCEFIIDTKHEILGSILDANDLRYDRFDSVKELKKTLKEAVDRYNDTLVKKEAVREKVILYTLEMSYSLFDEEGEEEYTRDDFNSGYNGVKAPSLKFGFREAIKVTVGDEVIGYFAEDNEDYKLNLSWEEKEIPYTKEASDLFFNLHKNLVFICDKLNSFFGEENDKVIESIQKDLKLLL